MQRLAPLLASFVVLGIASGAEANRLSIEFDFTNSVLTFSGISIPPSGGFTSAGAILIVPSNGSTSVQDGPATLRSWRFNGTVDNPFGFFSVVEGTFTLTQLGSAYGSFDAAGGTAFISQDLNVFFGLSLQCFGLFCPGGFPVTSSGSESVNGSFVFEINNISVPGGATIMSNISFTLDGTPVVLNLVGTEVTRTVPELGSAPMLAAGAALLAGIWWLRRT